VNRSEFKALPTRNGHSRQLAEKIGRAAQKIQTNKDE
jgi:hypothetical protein